MGTKKHKRGVRKIRISKNRKTTSILPKASPSEANLESKVLLSDESLPIIETNFEESDFTGDLPIDYDENKLVLQFADPQTAYVYWSISLQERCRLRMGRGGHLVLRLYNISHGSREEFWLSEDTNTIMLALEDPNCVYRAELGYYSSIRYSCLALSNSIEVPANKPSEEKAVRVEAPIVFPSENQNDDNYVSECQNARTESSLAVKEQKTIEEALNIENIDFFGEFLTINGTINNSSSGNK